MSALSHLLESHASDLAMTDGMVVSEHFEFCDDSEVADYIAALDEVARDELITEALVNASNDAKLFKAVVKVLGKIAHNDVTALLEELSDALKEAATNSIRPRLLPYYEEAVSERNRDVQDRRNWLGLSAVAS